MPADEICSLLAGASLSAALERALRQSPQLQSMAATQLAWCPAEAGGEAAALWSGSGAGRACSRDASLDEEQGHRLSAGALAAGPSDCPAPDSGPDARPESPRVLLAALLQRPARSVAAAAGEQDSSPISAEINGRLLSQPVQEACPAPLAAAPAAGTVGAVSARGEAEAEEDGASGVRTPPASSPVAAARPLPLTPSPGQGSPALASRALQQRAAPRQPTSPCGSPRSPRPDASLAVQQEPQQPQLQPLAARRTLHPCWRAEPEAPAQQPASNAAAVERQPASSPAQTADQRDGQRHEDQAQRQHPRVPQALLAAAQRSIGCLRLMVRLAAALAGEDKGAALPLARQLLDAAPRHPLALVLAAQCQARAGKARHAWGPAGDAGSGAAPVIRHSHQRQAQPLPPQSSASKAWLTPPAAGRPRQHRQRAVPV